MTFKEKIIAALDSLNEEELQRVYCQIEILTSLKPTAQRQPDNCFSQQKSSSEGFLSQIRQLATSASDKKIEPKDKLYREMSKISEDCYCARWMEYIEFFLWRAILGGARVFGVRQITSAEITHLKSLAEASGGWWYWSSESKEPVFVPMEEWSVIYNNFSSK